MINQVPGTREQGPVKATRNPKTECNISDAVGVLEAAFNALRGLGEKAITPGTHINHLADISERVGIESSEAGLEIGIRRSYLHVRAMYFALSEAGDGPHRAIANRLKEILEVAGVSSEFYAAERCPPSVDTAKRLADFFSRHEILLQDKKLLGNVSSSIMDPRMDPLSPPEQLRNFRNGLYAMRQLLSHGNSNPSDLFDKHRIYTLARGESVLNGAAAELAATQGDEVSSLVSALQDAAQEYRKIVINA